MMKGFKMDKREIKYLIALLRSEAETGEKPALPIPEGFKESFESQVHFRGWINFENTWYIDQDNDPWKVIPLERPLVEDWHDTLRKFVPELTPDGKIMEPEEWDKKSRSTK